MGGKSYETRNREAKLWGHIYCGRTTHCMKYTCIWEFSFFYDNSMWNTTIHTVVHNYSRQICNGVKVLEIIIFVKICCHENRILEPLCIEAMIKVSFIPELDSLCKLSQMILKKFYKMRWAWHYYINCNSTTALKLSLVKVFCYFLSRKLFLSAFKLKWCILMACVFSNSLSICSI